MMPKWRCSECGIDYGEDEPKYVAYIQCACGGEIVSDDKESTEESRNLYALYCEEEDVINQIERTEKKIDTLLERLL